MPYHPGRIGRFYTELKRRKVFRVLAAYAVVAWAVTQITATVAPALFLPGWTLTLVVVLALVGFPVAVVLSWAYDRTPDGVRRTPPPGTPPHDIPAVPACWRRATALGLIVLVVAATGWVGWRLRPGPEPVLDSNLVAVLPFRVSADASLDYLREGMLDVLAAKLSGEVGPATIDPRSILVAWQRAGGDATTDLPLPSALAVARSFGAGHLLLGEIVSVPPRLTLSARLIATRDGRVAYQATVEGPADSLPTLVDGLAARLLLVQAGETEHRLDAITTTSLPALSSYLQGQALFRAGHIEEALDRYLRALELDSTFAHAALGAWSARVWGIARPGVLDRVQSIAWSGRDRLSERDRLHLVALAGPDWPTWPTAARQLEATQSAVSMAPDRPELWYHYGDVLTHDGARLGIADWREQAVAAFERAGTLGPMTTEAVVHLLDLLIDAGHTQRGRAHGEAYLAETQEGEVPHYLRWLMTAAAEPAASDAAVEARLAAAPWRIHRWIVQNGQLLGRGFERDAERALANLRAAPQPEAERIRSRRAEAGFLLNAGRPGAASNVFAARIGPAESAYADRFSIYAALYWDGHHDHASRAADALERRRAPDDSGAEAHGFFIMEQCALAQWRIAQNQVGGLSPTLQLMRAAAPPLEAEFERHALLCAVLLETLATQARGGDVAHLADRLGAEFDAQLSHFSHDMLFSAVPLVMARIRESQGRLNEALAWTRRRPGAGSTQHTMLATYLREEGRLAALVGDRDGAIRAYSHYVALRWQPEPAAAAELERARQALAALTDEPRQGRAQRSLLR